MFRFTREFKNSCNKITTGVFKIWLVYHGFTFAFLPSKSRNVGKNKKKTKQYKVLSDFFISLRNSFDFFFLGFGENKLDLHNLSEGWSPWYMPRMPGSPLTLVRIQFGSNLLRVISIYVRTLYFISCPLGRTSCSILVFLPKKEGDAAAPRVGGGAEGKDYSWSQSVDRMLLFFPFTLISFKGWRVILVMLFSFRKIWEKDALGKVIDKEGINVIGKRGTKLKKMI